LRTEILKFNFNRDERYKIYLAAYKACTTVTVTVTGSPGETSFCEKDFTDMIKLINKAERKHSYQDNRLDLKESLDEAPLGTVFYRCSRHRNPGKDHEAYQGKLFYDRFWESKNPQIENWLARAIKNYIKKYDLVSVQKISGPPVYLTTRPYCKHYFIPQETLTVLTTEPDKKKPRN
jgi:hypothetical protein